MGTSRSAHQGRNQHGSASGRTAASNGSLDGPWFRDGVPAPASRAGLLALQRTAGNRAVAAMVARQNSPVQRQTLVVQRAHAEEGSPGHRPNLDQDDTGPGVRLLQRKLRQHNYLVPVTGTFGPTTRALVIRYQQDHRELHPATGGVGPMTWASLDGTPMPTGGGEKAEGTPENRPDLDEGDTGPAVKLLQQRLSRRGYFLPTTGTFGPATHTAVVHYQEDRAELHPATGGVGPMTWASLDAAGDPVAAGEVDDGRVRDMIRATLWNTNKKNTERDRCFEAWRVLVRQRESEAAGKSGDPNLAAAEHYMYARYLSAGYTPAVAVDVMAIAYQVSKLFGAKEDRAGAPAPTPPSLGQLKWEALGAHDGAWSTIPADKEVPLDNPRPTVGPKPR